MEAKQDREQYETALSSQLAEWAAKIDEFAERAENSKGELRDKMKAEVEDLRRQQKQARTKLDELKQSSESAWGDVKTGIEKASTNIRNAVARAGERYQNQTTS